MKILSALFLTSIMMLGGLMNSTSSLTEKPQYYFIEAQCEECAIDWHTTKQNFYVVTETIQKSDAPVDVDALTNAFKTVLEQKFKDGKPLYSNIVVRTSTSEKKLARLKNNYREKYLKKGYQVKLLRE